jgi:hypothetical protein
VVEIPAEDRQRIGVEDGQQLVIGEPEAVLQERCGGGGQGKLRTARSRRTSSEQLVLSARSGDA